MSSSNNYLVPCSPFIITGGRSTGGSLWIFIDENCLVGGESPARDGICEVDKEVTFSSIFLGKQRTNKLKINILYTSIRNCEHICEHSKLNYKLMHYILCVEQ